MWIVAVVVVVVEFLVVEEAEDIFTERLRHDGCGMDSVSDETVGSSYTLCSDSNSWTPFRGTTVTMVTPALLFTRVSLGSMAIGS